MVTIRDVAQQAGVSVTTASRALNGHRDVSEATRTRVREAARRLGYQPNALARGLVLGRTETVGVVVSELPRGDAAASPFMFQVLAGLSHEAGALQFDLVLFGTSPRAQAQIPYRQLCRKRGVDGAVLMGVRLDDPYTYQVVETDIPTVVIDVPVVGPRTGYVTSDNVAGAALAVRHLAELGHRHVGFINGHDSAHVSRARFAGYRAEAEAVGIRWRPEWVWEGDFSERSGYEGCRALLTRCPQMTAVFCASDLMAVGAMAAIRDLGRRVGRDVSVVGFDNMPFARLVTPGLTTVHQDPFEMGRAAIRVLVELMQGSTGYGRVLPVSLKVRRSTGPAG